MTREDEVAARAVRASTLKSLKVKKELRIKQIKEEAAAKIREINIQYAEDPERLRAKYAADDYARTERAKRRAARAIERERRHIEKERRLRPYSVGEEIFSSIVQGVGACLFIAATVLLDVIALPNSSAEEHHRYFVLFTSFGILMVLNYIMSVLYHALTSASAKEVFRRLNHVGVFLAIACAYTTYSFAAITNLFGLIVMFVIWALCLVGLMMYAIAGSRLEAVNIIFYAVLGWTGLFVCNQLYRALPASSFGLLVTAGVFYTVGLVFCSLRKIKYFHAVGDVLMLLASVYLFFSFLQFFA